MREGERRPLSVSHPARPAAATAGPVVLFTAGGSRFAVEANEVEEIRDRDDRTAFRKRNEPEVIDFALRVGLGTFPADRLLVLKPGGCALAVSDVERMTALPRVVPLPGLFRGEERRWYRGLLLLENDVVPLIRTEYWRKTTGSK